VWYSYRKYRWLCDHLFSAHCKQEALTHRRIMAQQARIDARQKKNASKAA
jgi:hypothetical protein